MKITAITAQARNPDRVNISIDGAYRFSLDIFQVTELGVRVGKEYTEGEVAELAEESTYSKLYTKSLEYSMLRPHSAREMRDYLWRKTRPAKYKTRAGEIKEREGVDETIAARVLARLTEKGYIDDEKFARWWVENRQVAKGTSQRKLKAELAAKGIAPAIIEATFMETGRNDQDELAKIIAKKRRRYPDEQKFLQYLARQGFRFEDIKEALSKQE